MALEPLAALMSEASTAFRRPPGPSEPVELSVDPATLETLTRARDDYGDMVAITRQNGRLAYFITMRSKYGAFSRAVMPSTARDRASNV